MIIVKCDEKLKATEESERDIITLLVGEIARKRR